MSKRKLRNWAIGFVLAAFTFLGLAYLAMNLAVDYMLRQMVGESQVSSQTLEQQEDDTRGQTTSSDAQSSEGPARDVNDSASPSTVVTNDALATNDGQKGGKATTKDGTPSFDYNPDVSETRTKDVEEHISLDEKVLVTSIVMEHFSGSELNLFRKLLSGGLNKEEKKKMRALFLTKLSEEQYNKLIAIAEKYGVSQGKTYDEMKK